LQSQILAGESAPSTLCIELSRSIAVAHCADTVDAKLIANVKFQTGAEWNRDRRALGSVVLAWVRRVLEMEDCGKQRGGVLMAETRRVDEQLVFGLMGRKAYAQIGRRAFTYDEYGSELVLPGSGSISSTRAKSAFVTSSTSWTRISGLVSAATNFTR
jgi:hypothetical protein